MYKRHIIIKLFFKSLYIFLGQIGLIVDRIYKHEGDTLGNTVVAKKVRRC